MSTSSTFSELPAPASRSPKPSLAHRSVRIGTGALLVGAAPALALLSNSPAGAATITVANTNDSGSGSLRAAITDASPGDTIDLSSLSGTINLLNPVRIDKTLTIVGPGAANLTVVGGAGSSDSVFKIQGGNGVTTISGLTITGGENSAINCWAQTYAALKLDGVVVTGNDGSVAGGLYSVDCGSLEIVDSTFSNNNSTYYGGGGVGFKGTGSVTITGSTFDNNSVNGSSYATGGGAFVDTSGTVSISNSTFTNNYSYYGGGGVDLHSNDVLISGSTFANNTSHNDSGGGASIESKGNGGNLFIRTSTFADNSSPSGGGIASRNLASVTISETTISGNSAVYKGSGLYIASDSNDIYNTTIVDNTADTGGAAYIKGDLTMKFVTVTGNTAASRVAGLYLHRGTDTIDASIIVENGSTPAAAIKTYRSTVAITQSLVGDYSDANVTTDCTDVTGVSDAGLGSLSDNGGPTLTKAPLASSPAIDLVTALPHLPSAFDQRGYGYARVTGDHADAGAVEYGSTPPPSSSTTSSSTSSTSTSSTSTSSTSTSSTSTSSTSTSSSSTSSTSTTTPSSTTTTDGSPTTTVPVDDSIVPEFGAGDSVRNGTARTLVSLTGLTPGSAVEVTIHSEPIVLATGFADANGNFSQYVTIPADTPAGSHAITVTGTDLNGNPIAKSLFFSINADGVVTAISSDGPTPEPTGTGGLPTTGSDSFPLMATGSALIILGGAGAGYAARRRQVFGHNAR